MSAMEVVCFPVMMVFGVVSSCCLTWFVVSVHRPTSTLLSNSNQLCPTWETKASCCSSGWCTTHSVAQLSRHSSPHMTQCFKILLCNAKLPGSVYMPYNYPKCVRITCKSCLHCLGSCPFLRVSPTSMRGVMSANSWTNGRR